MQQLARLGKRLLPNWVKKQLQNALLSKAIRNREYDLGMYLIEKMVLPDSAGENSLNSYRVEIKTTEVEKDISLEPISIAIPT